MPERRLMLRIAAPVTREKHLASDASGGAYAEVLRTRLQHMAYDARLLIRAHALLAFLRFLPGARGVAFRATMSSCDAVLQCRDVVAFRVIDHTTRAPRSATCWSRFFFFHAQTSVQDACRYYAPCFAVRSMPCA